MLNIWESIPNIEPDISNPVKEKKDVIHSIEKNKIII